jgi:hypothetical protein
MPETKETFLFVQFDIPTVVSGDSSVHIGWHDWWCLMTAVFTFSIVSVMSAKL